MSSDFYFRQWKKTFLALKAIVEIDVYFQKTKAHDKKICEATRRLSGLLGQYLAIYNEIWDSLHQNLQVQKTSYIRDVLSAVVSRILELKHELRKLEVSEYHFGGNGLITYKLTPYDAEMNELPEKVERPENMNVVLKDIFEQVPRLNYMQVITEIRQQQNKRSKWEKALLGNLAPPAPEKLKENAAKLIQRVCKKYFEIKREKITQCKHDEMIGIKMCLKPKAVNKEKLEQAKEKRRHLQNQYNKEWVTEYENLKQDYLKRKSDDLKEYYRDHIRDWFKIWYKAIHFFHDIPGTKQGGAAIIFKEELPTPGEWLEEYKSYLAEKKANKGKSAMDRKFAKMEAKMVEMAAKKEQHMKKKLEEELRKKMMKNPTLHPGFDFPESKKTGHILEVIGKYDKDWSELDAADTLDVKEKFVRDIDISNANMEAKLEIVSAVEEHMRNELQLLKSALKRDYENSDEKMPEPMKQKHKKGKKKSKVKKTLSLNITEQLEDLVFRQYLIEYPNTKIEQFFGDPNLTGDDMRCDYAVAFPHNGEMRNIWWEKCRESVHGFQKILLVGPAGSGKTMLVHILASMNEAALFELDPSKIPEVFQSAVYLGQMVKSVASCAKAIEPSVIHIKHLQKLYYRKVPPEDANVDWKLIQRYFVKKLFKHIHKTDKVTVIGTCLDPWVTKSSTLLKQFTTVVLTPNSSYGTMVQIIKDWVLSHTVVPPDFDVSSLARALHGYSIGFLKEALEKFLSADTIIRIAARGLSPMEVYDFVLQYDTQDPVDYTLYLKWYSEKTAMGKKEQNHIEEQMAFKQAMQNFMARMEKKKQKDAANTPTNL